MSSSKIASKTNVAGHMGQRWIIECMDSPSRSFSNGHPFFPAATLRKVHYHQEFVAYFCFWTNATKVSGASGDPADRLYSVVRIVPWTVVGDWTIAYPPAPAAPTLTAVTPHDITSPMAGRATVNPIGRAQDHHVEVRPPSGITSVIAWDGSS
jgi:hypothetical protein